VQYQIPMGDRTKPTGQADRAPITDLKTPVGVDVGETSIGSQPADMAISTQVSGISKA
jgi:hypothetical protein